MASRGEAATNREPLDIDASGAALLSAVAHELRNSLNAIVTWMDLLEVRPDAQTTERAVAVVRENVAAMDTIITDLVALARLCAGEPELETRRFDMAELVGACLDAARPLAARRKQRIEYEAAPGPLPVLADRERIGHALRRLLETALGVTPDGGQVDVKLNQGDSYAVIEVRDAGPGVDAGQSARLFDPLWRENPYANSPGLGPAVLRMLAEANDGGLDAKSPGQGQGASFSLRVPLAG